MSLFSRNACRLLGDFALKCCAKKLAQRRAVVLPSFRITINEWFLRARVCLLSERVINQHTNEKSNFMIIRNAGLFEASRLRALSSFHATCLKMLHMRNFSVHGFLPKIFEILK